MNCLYHHLHLKKYLSSLFHTTLWENFWSVFQVLTNIKLFQELTRYTDSRPHSIKVIRRTRFTILGCFILNWGHCSLVLGCDTSTPEDASTEKVCWFRPRSAQVMSRTRFYYIRSYHFEMRSMEPSFRSWHIFLVRCINRHCLMILKPCCSQVMNL